MSEVSVMSTFLTDVGSFFTQVVTWAGTLIDMIVGEPALLVTVFGTAIVGFVIGWVSRLFRA